VESTEETFVASCVSESAVIRTAGRVIIGPQAVSKFKARLMLGQLAVKRLKGHEIIISGRTSKLIRLAHSSIRMESHISLCI
jgi:hypothetical protein